jgi:hypothetical protein
MVLVLMRMLRTLILMINIQYQGIRVDCTFELSMLMDRLSTTINWIKHRSWERKKWVQGRKEMA